MNDEQRTRTQGDEHTAPPPPAWLRHGARLARLLRLFRMRRPALLVIRPGSLGDALLFTGALRALRERYPAHRIVLIASRRARPIFERAPEPDLLLSFDEERRTSVALRDRLRRILFATRALGRAYELAAVAWETQSAAGVTREAEGWLAPFLGLVCAERKISFDPSLDRNVHELDRIVALLRDAGCDGVRNRQEIWPDPHLRESDRRWAEEKDEG